MKLGYKYNSNHELQSLYVNDTLLMDNVEFKNGQLFGYRYPDGSVHERDYDLARRITYLGYPNYHATIEYNSVGGMVTVGTTSQNKRYSYDFAGRLISYENNQSQNQKYSYDANGNRIGLDDSLNGKSQYTYIENTNILNQVTRTYNDVVAQQDYIYDETGNIINDGLHTYTYATHHRLVGVDENIAYAYNSNNYRVSKTIDGVKTYFIYDIHKLLGEYDEEGNVLKEYIYLGDIPVAMIEEGKVYYIYTDYLNTPRRVTDENHVILWRWESSPYGKELPTGNIIFNLRFPGQYYDAETALHYNINRDYNPILGRYIQSDPVGFKGGVNTFAIPATAYASTFYMDDEEGRIQFYKSYGTTMLSTIALKYTVRAKRPDNDDRDSFPSGHTSSAMSGAVFIHRRYGLEYAIPAYIGAIYTGYSRIHVNRHHYRDVIAGAAIGAVSSWYFVDPMQKLSIIPTVGSEYKGIQFNYMF